MLSMNDAHIYCTINQVAQEFADNIKMVRDYYETFGFEDYFFRLSLWDPKNTEKYICSKENWETTQNYLRKIYLSLMRVSITTLFDGLERSLVGLRR